MSPQMMLLNECLPVDALTLGSMVTSIQNPIMDAFVPKSSLPPEEIQKVPYKSFQGLMSSANATSFKVAMKRLLDIGHSSESEAAATLDSVRVNRYILKQPRNLFRTLCLGDERARQWLNEGIQAGSKSYLVVELQTATNPTITRRNADKKKTDAKVTVPVSMIAAHGVDILGMADAMDINVGASASSSNRAAKSFETEGETIFAIGYKKITWKSWGLKRKTVDKAMLDSEITWSMLGQKRSRDDEDEMISVDLADELDAKASIENGEEDEDDEEEDDEDDEELEELLKTGVAVDGMTYLLPTGGYA